MSLQPPEGLSPEELAEWIAEQPDVEAAKVAAASTLPSLVSPSANQDDSESEEAPTLPGMLTASSPKSTVTPLPPIGSSGDGSDGGAGGGDNDHDLHHDGDNLVDAAAATLDQPAGPSPKAVSFATDDGGDAEYVDGDKHTVDPEGVGEEEEMTRGQKINQFFNATFMMIVMTIVTFYALYADDVRLAAFYRKSDTTFAVLTCIALFLFLVEFIVFSCWKPAYFNGFFFYLDAVAVLSLIPDIPWIWDPLYKAMTGQEPAEANQDLSVARAGRASRAGTRAGRMVRFIRIVRLVRVVKLYKYCSRNKQEEEEQDEKHEEEEPFSDEVGGSLVGKQLSDAITRIVIMGVLCMLLIFPLLSNEVQDQTRVFGLQQLYEYKTDNLVDPSVFQTMVTEYKNEFGNELLYLRVNNTVELHNTYLLDQRRKVEYQKLSTDAPKDEAWFDVQDTSQTTAMLNTFLTTFIILLLGVGSAVFSKVTTKAVVEPIERMVGFVKVLAKDPFTDLHQGDDDDPVDDNETTQLQTTLTKLAGLLQVGFGEAGAEIIGANMAQGDGDGLNVMIPGKKMFAVFGFCDIRRFDECVECLEEKVMVFVNGIASMVHGTAAQYNGFANKNIGNAFLMIWKFPTEEKLLEDEERRKERVAKLRAKQQRAAGHSATVHPVDFDDEKSASEPLSLVDRLAAERKTPFSPKKGGGDAAGELQAFIHDATPLARYGMQQMADQALLSYVLTIVKVYTSPDVLQWTTASGKIATSIPGYRMTMGFGLHTGWAIEGAIGSLHKVDASYLSPNVNMSARLEAATKQWHVDLLFSGPFYTLLQEPLKARCRHLDRVTVKGSKIPLDLYTFDIHPSILDPESPVGERVRRTMGVMEGDESEDRHHRYDSKAILDRFALLQGGVDNEFVGTFNQACDAYIDGDWKEAKRLLDAAQELSPFEEDGPSQVMYSTMGETEFKAPSGWAGYRALTKK